MGVKNKMAQSRSPPKKILRATLHLGTVAASSFRRPRVQPHECYSASSDDDEDVKLPRKKRTNRKLKKRDWIERMEYDAEDDPTSFRTQMRMEKATLDKLMEIVGKVGNKEYLSSRSFFFCSLFINTGFPLVQVLIFLLESLPMATVLNLSKR